MNINLEKKNGKIIIALEGRLDTVTSVEFNDYFEAKQEEFAKATEDEVILDFSNLEYVSSAGLRALLATKKSLNQYGKNLSVTNINNVIKEVFNVTGFVKIIKID